MESGLELTLTGVASLIHIQHPSTEVGQSRDEYFARINVAFQSITGKRTPLVYDVPLTQEQYNLLNSQINDEGFRKSVCEAEGYRHQPCIDVSCDLVLTPKKGD